MVEYLKRYLHYGFDCFIKSIIINNMVYNLNNSAHG